MLCRGYCVTSCSWYSDDWIYRSLSYVTKLASILFFCSNRHAAAVLSEWCQRPAHTRCPAKLAGDIEPVADNRGARIASCNMQSDLVPGHGLIVDVPQMSLQWTQLSPSGIPPAPRCNYGAAIVGNQLYIFGGKGATTNTTDSLGKRRLCFRSVAVSVNLCLCVTFPVWHHISFQQVTEHRVKE
jgi:hypothetical protein